MPTSGGKVGYDSTGFCRIFNKRGIGIQGRISVPLHFEQGKYWYLLKNIHPFNKIANCFMFVCKIFANVKKSRFMVEFVFTAQN